MSRVVALEGASLACWLLKRGRKFKTWRSRFFVLRGSSLLYFVDERAQAGTPLGALELSSPRTAFARAPKRDKPWRFSITIPGRVLFLQASCAQDVAAWDAALASMRERLHGAAQNEKPQPEPAAAPSTPSRGVPLESSATADSPDSLSLSPELMQLSLSDAVEGTPPVFSLSDAVEGLPPSAPMNLNASEPESTCASAPQNAGTVTEDAPVSPTAADALRPSDGAAREARAAAFAAVQEAAKAADALISHDREALASSRAALGDSHEETLAAALCLAAALDANGRASEAVELLPLLRQASAAAKASLGDENPTTLDTMSTLAHVLRAGGEDKEASSLFQVILAGRVVSLGENHVDTLTTLLDVASDMLAEGHINDAIPLLRSVLDGRRASLGDTHPATLDVTNLYASALTDVRGHKHMITLARRRPLALTPPHPPSPPQIGRVDDAASLFSRIFEDAHRVLGPAHASTLMSMSNFAVLLRSTGRLDEAESMHARALRGLRDALGDDHAWTLSSINGLGNLLRDRGDLGAAERAFREALAGRRAALGPANASTLKSMQDLALCLQKQGRLVEAAALLKETAEGRSRALGDHHPDTLKSAASLSNVAVPALDRFRARWRGARVRGRHLATGVAAVLTAVQLRSRADRAARLRAVLRSDTASAVVDADAPAAAEETAAD